MEQSTWIMLNGVPSTLIARSTQDTMPCDMENVSSPSGLPMAATVSPMASLLESPSTTGESPVTSILTTAIS